MKRKYYKILLRQGIESTAFFIVALWLVFAGLESIRSSHLPVNDVDVRVLAGVEEQGNGLTKEKKFSRIRSQVIDLGCLGKFPESIPVRGDSVRLRFQDCEQNGHVVEKIEWSSEERNSQELLTLINPGRHSVSTEFFRIGVSTKKSVIVFWRTNEGTRNSHIVRLTRN